MLAGQDCDIYESLPTDLNMSFLRFDQQVHASGTFLVDYKASRSRNVTFDLKTPSHVRFYVAPHDIDIDLFLYQMNSSVTTMVFFSLFTTNRQLT